MRIQRRFIGYCFTLGLITALIFVMSACSSTSSSTTKITSVVTPTTSTPTTPAPKLVSIAIAKTSPVNLDVGSNEQFTATGTYDDGSLQDVTLSSTWATTDAAIASVSLTGNVKGVKAGNINITASKAGITSPSVQVITVIPGPKLTSIAVSRSVVSSLVVGGTQQFTATGTISNGTTEDLTAKVTWDSSEPTVATISANGLATGVAAGKTAITATYSDISSYGMVLTVVAP